MYGNFGFIHEKIEIKILILFILRRLPEPIPFYTLAELALCDDGVSYFDFTECVSELIKTEHIKMDESKYSITDKGVRNGEITENNLPYSVRDKAEGKISVARIAEIRNALITTSRRAEPDGSYTVNLALSDGVGDIVSMELYAANEKQASGLEKGFRRNAEGVYKALIEKMLG